MNGCRIKCNAGLCVVEKSKCPQFKGSTLAIMASNKLLAERDKIQKEILVLENTLRADNNITDVLPSDSGSDDESDGSGPAVVGVVRIWKSKDNISGSMTNSALKYIF
ncbi:hypothetical protein IRJ41_001783 [Triplophysa rosa]|uniref:Uncharacterized protein n=1 Tax=Triplophysa rosa TaxID=992332 RepID=A0A9W7X1U8_TRIRA|nr:hypothetical protein IRJ41_001783 [Triplophysa rosa]